MCGDRELVVVLAFKAVYTLEHGRRDREKKVIAIYVEMKDMMRVLLSYVHISPHYTVLCLWVCSLRNMKNDELKGTDGRKIEDRLGSIVKETAEDIKLCSNACDAYVKKKLLAKVIQGPFWDVKLLSWGTRFEKRRKEFESELSIHTAQGIDKANTKLNVIGDVMEALKTMFEQLISPEQKELAATVAKKGGVKALRNNDKMLLELGKDPSKAPSTFDAEIHGALLAKFDDANTDVDELRKDIFETPDDAIKRNETVFFRKFDEQKRQIDQLTITIQRESDRVIQEIKGGPHERICDRVRAFFPSLKRVIIS